MRHLRNSSNYLTIAELRFSPVANLMEKIHAIQMAFRVSNYVDSAAIKSQSIQVEQIDAQKLLVPNVRSAYIFVNKNRTWHSTKSVDRYFKTEMKGKIYKLQC